MIHCQFENGNIATLRHITIDAISVNEGKILLVRRSPHSSAEPNKWALPGGYLDRDENMAEGVLRELKEETGHEGRNPVLFMLNDNPNRPGDDRQNFNASFIVETGEKISDHDHEISEIKWFDLDHLPSKQEIAFDHSILIQYYLKYLKNHFSLPFYFHGE